MNYTHNQTISVMFSARSGEEQYNTIRKIQAKQFIPPVGQSLTEKINDLPRLTSLINNETETMTELDILQAAKSLKTAQYIMSNQTNCKRGNDYFTNSTLQDVCSPYEDSPCCGHGQCLPNGGNAEYRCSCNKGYSGALCHITSDQATLTTYNTATSNILSYITNQTVKESNIDVIVETLKMVAQTNALTTNSSNQFTQILTQMSNVTLSNPTPKQYVNQLTLVETFKKSADQSN